MDTHRAGHARGLGLAIAWRLLLVLGSSEVVLLVLPVRDAIFRQLQHERVSSPHRSSGGFGTNALPPSGLCGSPCFHMRRGGWTRARSDTRLAHHFVWWSRIQPGHWRFDPIAPRHIEIRGSIREL
jgi:hypothetical protein